MFPTLTEVIIIVYSNNMDFTPSVICHIQFQLNCIASDLIEVSILFLKRRCNGMQLTALLSWEVELQWLLNVLLHSIIDHLGANILMEVTTFCEWTQMFRRIQKRVTSSLPMSIFLLAISDVKPSFFLT